MHRETQYDERVIIFSDCITGRGAITNYLRGRGNRIDRLKKKMKIYYGRLVIGVRGK